METAKVKIKSEVDSFGKTHVTLKSKSLFSLLSRLTLMLIPIGQKNIYSLNIHRKPDEKKFTAHFVTNKNYYTNYNESAK